MQKDSTKATAEHTAVQSANVDAGDDAVVDSGGAATADDLVMAYKQSPEPDAEINEELYCALSRSWLNRADVDPILGTIGYDKGKRAKRGAKIWMQRGKSTRAGSAL